MGNGNDPVRRRQRGGNPGLLPGDRVRQHGLIPWHWLRPGAGCGRRPRGCCGRARRLSNCPIIAASRVKREARRWNGVTVSLQPGLRYSPRGRFGRESGVRRDRVGAVIRAIGLAQRTSRRTLITICVMLATVMQALDTTIANVALPHMQGSLSATQDQISWVLTSYIVAAAIATPSTGFVAARLGRKRLFVISVSGFVVASMLCGIATSLTELVVFRLLQGVFGAALVPLSQALMFDTYPKERHGWAMAVWGMGTMVAPILGPTLGGYLTEYYDWRWIFYINLPFGLLALIGILAFVPDTPIDRARSLDALGFALLSLAIGAFQMLLDRGELKDWFGSTEIVIEAVIAALCLYLFIVHALTTNRPFFDPRIFGDRTFVTGLVLVFIVASVMMSTMALLPPFLQTLMGYPVMTAGIIMAPRGIGTLCAMISVSRLIGRFDPRLIMLFGFSMAAYALWRYTGFTPEVSVSTISWTGFLQGFGMGFLFVPLSTMTFATLPQQHRTEAAGLYALVRNTGGSIGISVVTAFLAHNQQVNHAALAERATPYSPAFRVPLLPDAWSLETAEGLARLNEEIDRQAQTIAYLEDFRMIMTVAIFAIPCLLLLRRPPRPGRPAETQRAAADD
ncbi:MAG: DHA2 family efflux MFS transporter permease subunit [Proteobacteria bacterium]|nr:DHA2 family efflux MFS transporter permease subunit [Pseudomonadota bacterium]MBI3495951.1 DHA2 family efflux MFS transporter permease subunit [Pseudomonadota bacterium]